MVDEIAVSEVLTATTTEVDDTEVSTATVEVDEILENDAEVDELTTATVEVGRIATVVVSLMEEDEDIVGNGEEETVVRLTVIVTALGDCELLPVSPKKLCVLLDMSQLLDSNCHHVSDKL